eukprot:SAG31_NODE_1034_length_10228_cov_89.107316_2_plen_109_part_00
MGKDCCFVETHEKSNADRESVALQGYPSTWKKADGSGWRTMYQGWHLARGKEDTKLALLADSPDAISWAPAKVKAPVFNVSNCVLKNGGAEFSVVYDDAAHTAAPKDR